MPTVYREGPYRFFFNSREETRVHIHVQSPDGVGKFGWSQLSLWPKSTQFLSVS